jgi:hypothetical protein
VSIDHLQKGPADSGGRSAAGLVLIYRPRQTGVGQLRAEVGPELHRQPIRRVERLGITTLLKGLDEAQ